MNIEVNLNEINSVEKIISNILIENDFNKLNENVNKKTKNANNKFLYPNSIKENKEFVSIKKAELRPYATIMTEEDFYKIVGAEKRGLSKKSGIYQEYLYSHYIEAVEQNDEGYICDILNRALEFKTNLAYIKELMKNKTFADEWRKDFGSESAVELFKRKGSIRLVNIVKERAK